ncbi:hypothetical protein ACIOEX_03325 [Streptomyces sp. NPDC087850]|uniref:hypothetical protein n=1 Tax=Streptomyces sp. NPDC087850 TaxID=3365809 RepID=UPI003827F021
MSADNCGTCRKLNSAKEAAEREGRHGDVVDCTVLLRRHPQHDTVPVPAIIAGLCGWFITLAATGSP